MQQVPSNNINPWLEIPLEDYERHMLHDTVGQLTLLNGLTKKYLSMIKPDICLFMGVAGGNGLEHIDNTVTNQVFGIDINQDYLDFCNDRFKNKIDHLSLLRLDSTKNSASICHAQFIWAGLILEYTGISSGFEFASTNIASAGHFITTIQSNNNLEAVSPTGVESIRKVSAISHAIDPGEMLQVAAESGYRLINHEENALPNGKSFLTYHFVYQ